MVPTRLKAREKNPWETKQRGHSPPGRVSSRADSHRLEHAASPELLYGSSGFEREAHLVVVGLDAADVMGRGRVQGGHEEAERVPKLRSDLRSNENINERGFRSHKRRLGKIENTD